MHFFCSISVIRLTVFFALCPLEKNCYYPKEEKYIINNNMVTTTTKAGTTAAAFVSRKIDKLLYSREQSEGVGARVRRTIGTENLRSFDPFLMLDEFSTGLPGGFPPHPHRGMYATMFILL